MRKQTTEGYLDGFDDDKLQGGLISEENFTKKPREPVFGIWRPDIKSTFLSSQRTTLQGAAPSLDRLPKFTSTRFRRHTVCSNHNLLCGQGGAVPEWCQ